MDEKLYNVVFNGEILDGYDPVNVKNDLAVLFRAGPEKIEKLFSGKPTVIMSKVDGRQAQKYKDALAKAGARCKVLPLDRNMPVKETGSQFAEARRPGTSSTNDRICPKCGVVQTGSPECPNCGIIIERFLKSQSPERPGENEIPDKNMKAAGASRRSGPAGLAKKLSLPAVAILLIAAIIIWQLRPVNPPKDRLLETVNQIHAALESYTAVIEGTDEFVKMNDLAESDRPAPEDAFILGMSLSQFSQAADFTIEEHAGTLSLDNIENALQSADLIEETRNSNAHIQAEMDRLAAESENCSEEFKEIISGMGVFHKLYVHFTDLALYPGKQRELAAYWGEYSRQKMLMMVSFESCIERLVQLDDDPASPDLWTREYEKAMARLQTYKESQPD